VKLLKIAALGCALITPLAGTTAANATAFPVKNPVLTKNALYAAGPLPSTTCDELPVEAFDAGQARAYINSVLHCLENTWGPYLKKAGLPYEPVKVSYVKRLPKKFCGSDNVQSSSDSEVWYCDWDRSLTFILGPSWLAYPSDLLLFNETAAMYGFHVQKLTGLYDAAEDLRAGSKAEHREQLRRMRLQMECLGGAFMQSVWPLKGRTAEDWNKLLGYVRDDNLKHWMRTGFRTGDPASCNTWTAPSSKVAHNR
jgi:predicted metalloprotease